MTSINEKLIQLAQIAATETVIVSHEDLQSITGGREAQSCTEHCGERDTHFDGTSGQMEF
jgi:hypothetical protein